MPVNFAAAGAFSPPWKQRAVGSPVVPCWMARSQAGQRWRRKGSARVAPRWPCAHPPPPPVPRARRDHSPGLLEESLEVDGTSRRWDTAGRGQAGCLLCQVGASTPPCAAACLFPANMGCPLSASFFHPFSPAGCKRTQSQIFIYFFPFLLLRNVRSRSCRACFLPRRYDSSAPVLALWLRTIAGGHAPTTRSWDKPSGCFTSALCARGLGTAQNPSCWLAG